jgi:hypothetical protein
MMKALILSLIHKSQTVLNRLKVPSSRPTLLTHSPLAWKKHQPRGNPDRRLAWPFRQTMGNTGLLLPPSPGSAQQSRARGPGGEDLLSPVDSNPVGFHNLSCFQPGPGLRRAYRVPQRLQLHHRAGRHRCRRGR